MMFKELGSFEIASNVAAVNCSTLSNLRTSTWTLCQMFSTPAIWCLVRDVFNSLDEGSRKMCTTVQLSSSYGKGGKSASGNESVSLSKVPATTLRYLTFGLNLMRYSLSVSFSSSTSIDIINGASGLFSSGMVSGLLRT